MGKVIGHEFAESPSIQRLIKETVEQVEHFSQRISAVREAEPGGQERIQELSKRVDQVRGRPLFYDFIGSGIGNGPYVELEDGSVKMDLINGIGINILGHSHPRLIEAGIRGALSDTVVQGNLEPNMEWLRLAEKLVEIAGRKSRLKHAWITTSGSMANENILKIIRQKKTSARKVIAMKAAFAGRTTMMAEITDNPSMRVGLPEYNEVLRIDFYDKNDPKSTEKSLRQLKEHVANNPGDICGFMFEPMQGEGGYKAAPREYFIPLLEFCREQKIPVWADEIQTFCRTGEFFAFETLDIGEYIDVCTVAKTLQNAAALYTEEYNPQPGLIAGTFAGSSSALSAGLEVLKIMDEENYLGEGGRIAHVHEEFVGMLNRLNEGSCEGLLQDAGGLGLMVAVTPLDGSREKMIELVKVLFKNGLICFGCGRGPFRIRFLLPAIMSSKDIEAAGKIIEKSILELA